ncbi:MAG: hypothetical protein U0T73_03360 [Chitinophagales bacterium]
MKRILYFFCIGFMAFTATAKAHAGKKERDPKTDEKRKKILKGLNKSFQFLAYLNYSDRRVDRPLDGIGVFEAFRGKTINRVDVRVLYPYGINLDSPNVYHPTKFQKFANSTQFRTRNWVIENELLFHPGEEVDPIAMADSERNLWAKNIYKDVKFVVTMIDSNTVDITVLIRDKFNWSIASNIDYDKFTLGAEMRNVLGLPHQIGAYLSLNFRPDNLYTVSGTYSYNNIKSSFIDATAYGSYDKFQQGGGISIKRKFFSSKPQWAGHFKFNYYNQNQSAPALLSNPIPTKVQYNTVDFWMAKSFKFPGAFGERFPMLRLIGSTRFYRIDYVRRPYMHNESRSQNFVDQTTMLGSIGFARWDYYVDHRVYGLGPAEYFTKGLNAALIAGFQQDEELQERFYSGFALEYGKFFNKTGYLLTQVKYGGFSKPKEYQQVLLQWKNNFYTLPMKMGKCHVRQFFTTDINLGFNRPYGKEIVVNQYNGITGLYSTSLRGARSFAFNYEVDFLADFKVLGFNSSVFVFSDLVLLQQASVKSNYFQSSVGFGLRLRNLNFGIDFLQIMFAYYPNLNVPEARQYNVLGNYLNDRLPARNDLFLPNILGLDITETK